MMSQQMKNNSHNNKGKKWFVLIGVLCAIVLFVVGIHIYQDAQIEARVRQRNYINWWNDYFTNHLHLSVDCRVTADGVEVYEISSAFPPDLILEIEWFNKFNRYGLQTSKDELINQYLYFCEYGIAEKTRDPNLETLMQFCEFDYLDAIQNQFRCYGDYVDCVVAEVFKTYGDEPDEEEWALAAKKVLDEHKRREEG